MTEKLYYYDAYKSEFCAKVLSCEKRGELYSILLDKTAFFPEEGGQYSDKGTLGEAEVIDVLESEGEIYHLTTSPLAVGAEVVGKVDFDERYEKMQCHTAEHILSGIIHSLYGLDNVGFHLGSDDVTMDVSAPLTREELDRVEMLANEVVYKNVEVVASFPAKEELSGMQYRSKLDLSENVRIVKIGDYDSCACCAPHVRYTGEIGVIKILDFAKLRGGIRIFIAAGRRALRVFREYYKTLSEVSAQLSLPKSEVADGVSKLIGNLAEIKTSYLSYRTSVLVREAEELEYKEGNRVIVFDDASIPELIAYSNVARHKTGGMLVLLSGADNDYKYVISSNTVNLREKAAEINKSLLGRGGGKSEMIQGSFSCDYVKIKEYFNP